MPPKHIEKKDGINEQRLANLLIYNLSLIDTNVATRRSGNKFTVVSSVKGSETTFKYQETSIPLNLLYSFFLRYVLRIEHKVIKGSVIEVGTETNALIWLVGEQGKIFCLPTKNLTDIKKKCTEIAEYCYTQIDPYRIALYYFQQHSDLIKNGKETMSDEDIEMRRNYLESAEKQTDDIIEKSPKDFWALNLKGLIFLKRAIILADQTKENEKENEKVIEYRKNAFNYFKESIKRAKEAKEPFPPPHTGMGHVYYAQENFRESFSKYNKAIEEGENDAKAYLGKANSFLRFFLENNNKEIQNKKILQDRVLIRKIKFFPDDYKSVEEVFNAPKNTQKTYAIGFYKDAIKQFENVGRKRSKVTESLVQLEKIVVILKKGLIREKKKTLKDLIECLDTLNPI